MKSTRSVIAVAAAFCGLALPLVAQTPPLAPSGPPGDPTTAMKSLNQLEPRTIIDSLPFTITQPGSYYFVRNLEFTAASGDAITVSAANVTIDLMGFTLSSTTPVTGSGINVIGGDSTVTVRNGAITGATTGTFTSSSFVAFYGGFEYGVQMTRGFLSNLALSGCRENGLRASGSVSACDLLVTKNGNNGIVLLGGGHLERVRCLNNRQGAYGPRTVVDSDFSNNFTLGLQAGTSGGSMVSRSTFNNNGTNGMSSTLTEAVITGCSAISNGHDGIYTLGAVISNCIAIGNGHDNSGSYGIRCDNGVAIGCVSKNNDIGIGAADGVITSCTVQGNSEANISGANIVRTGNNPAP